MLPSCQPHEVASGRITYSKFIYTSSKHRSLNRRHKTEPQFWTKHSQQTQCRNSQNNGLHRNPKLNWNNLLTRRPQGPHAVNGNNAATLKAMDSTGPQNWTKIFFIRAATGLPTWQQSCSILLYGVLIGALFCSVLHTFNINSPCVIETECKSIDLCSQTP